jgi:hypothetical protein
MKQLAIFFLLSVAVFAADDPKPAQNAQPPGSAPAQNSAANTATPTCVKPPENPLQILKYVPPEFPSGATTHGDVLLSGIVDETGHVKNLEVLGGHPFLSGPIMEAASQWIVQTYCPQGKPVNAVVLLSSSWQRHKLETEIRVDADATKRAKKKRR